MYSEVNAIKMHELLTDNIYVELSKKVFSATVGILIDTNCALLLTDIFLYGFEAEFS